MATKVFNAPFNFSFFDVSRQTPDCDAIGTAWAATNNINFNTGIVAILAANLSFNPQTVFAPFGLITDEGDIPADATINSVQTDFDFSVTNGPSVDAYSDLQSFTLATTVGPQGIGTTAGHLTDFATAATLGIVIVSDFYNNYVFGLGFRIGHTPGGQLDSDRTLIITNFTVTVDYTPLGPGPGLIVDAGEDSNCLLSEGFDLVGSFIGDIGDDKVWTKADGPGDVTFEDSTSLETHVDFSANGKYLLKLTVDNGSENGHAYIVITVLDLAALPGPNPSI